MTNLISSFDGGRTTRVVVTWFRCSYSSGYSASGSFQTIAGFGKNRRDDDIRGEEGGKGHVGWQLYHRPVLRTRSRYPLQTPVNPRGVHRRALTEMSGPCKKHDKSGEATYKFLHRANYEIRKDTSRHVSPPRYSCHPRVRPRTRKHTRADTRAREAWLTRVVSFHI